MRTLFLAAALFAAPALAKAAEPVPPIAGRWALDLSAMPVPPEARPKSVVIRFDSQAGNRLAMTVDILDAGGGTRHMGGSYTLDGSGAPITGDLGEADIAAARMPAPGLLVMALGKGGIPASTRVYSVSSDGGTMTETAVYFAEDGKPVLRTNRFTRIR